MQDDTLLSVQLYSLRDMPSLRHQLEAVHSVGLQLVEMTSDNYEDPRQTRALMDELTLAASGGHIGIEPLRQRMGWVLDLCGEIGMRTLVLWGFPENEQPRTQAQWQRAGAELGGLAQQLRSHSIGFAFHNHDWELERFADGQLALDALFDGARGSGLGWQPDLAWLARGGAAVEELLAAHRDLIVACHVKDLGAAGAPANEEGWADLGHGTLPWDRWWPLLRGWGTRFMVLEHDQPSDPLRFLRRSVARARELAQAHPFTRP